MSKAGGGGWLLTGLRMFRLSGSGLLATILVANAAGVAIFVATAARHWAMSSSVAWQDLSTTYKKKEKIVV
jgi:hypothetical protein